MMPLVYAKIKNGVPVCPDCSTPHNRAIKNYGLIDEKKQKFGARYWFTFLCDKCTIVKISKKGRKTAKNHYVRYHAGKDFKVVRAK